MLDMKVNGETIWYSYLEDKDVYMVLFRREIFFTKERPITDAELKFLNDKLEEEKKYMEMAKYFAEHPEELEQYLK